LRREGQRLTWCEADLEGETFDVARLLHSGQPAGSTLFSTDYLEKTSTIVFVFGPFFEYDKDEPNNVRNQFLPVI